MKDKVRIGIVGTGFARTVQIPAFRQIEGTEVVSVASARFENAERTAREFGVPHFTGDWRETVAHSDVDLICITTPPVFHREMTVAALEAGKHVLCEKPMAMNAAEAAEMLEKSEEKNVLALIDHELRFLSGRRIAREMIRRGEIGAVRHAKYNFRAPHRGSPDLPWTWWSDLHAGGGALGAIGSHAFDTLRWMLETDIETVFCQTQTHVKRRRDPHTNEIKNVSSDDEANLILRLAPGEFVEDATASVALSMVEYPTYQNRVEIFGATGALRVEYDGALFVGTANAEEWRRADIALDAAVEGAPPTGWNNGFLAFAAKIVEALRAGKTSVENAATFADGLAVQTLLDAARESDRTGAAVKLAKIEAKSF